MKKNWITFPDMGISLEYDHIWEIGDFLLEHHIELREYVDLRVGFVMSALDVGDYDSAREQLEWLIAVAGYMKQPRTSGSEPMISRK